jgi:hypothetical protein
MTTNKINDQQRNKIFDEFFRKDVHQLIAWGYEDSLTKIHANLQEEEITGFIGEAIDERLGDNNTDERFDRYSLHIEKPISSQGRTGKGRLRLDIVIEDSSWRPRREYIFEAKRLCKGSHPIGKYTGKEGMECFIDDSYASQCSEAAMIGYLQSDDCQYWESELKRKFNQNNNNHLQKVEIIPSLPHEYFSKHQRKSGTPITIYHIFLVCHRSLKQNFP